MLDEVAMTYEIDSTPPAVASIKSVKVRGSSATVKFAASDPDFAGFQCRLDRSAFAPCKSPKRFSGLRLGSHRASVRTIDRVGNSGPAAEFNHSTAAVRARPRTTRRRSSGSPMSRCARRGVASSRSAHVPRRRALQGQPQAQAPWKDRRPKRATLAGGKTLKLKLTLKQAARLRLAERGRLKVVADAG